MASRRAIDEQLQTKAERMIMDCLVEVEALGCDVRLTESAVKLGEAKEALSEWVDEQIKTRLF